MAGCDSNPGQWFCDPVTQSYNGSTEHGIDIATPYGSNITAIYGGTVFQADYKPWGGEVGIKTYVPGYGYLNEYVQHLDTLNVSPGQTVNPGDLLGLSGGQLSGGNHPVDPQYSSGPHVEYGFGAPWLGGGPNPNPGPILMAVRNGAITVPAGAATPGATASNASKPGQQGGTQQSNNPLQNILQSVGQAIQGGAQDVQGGANTAAGTGLALLNINVPNPLCMLDPNLPGCNGNIFGTPQIQWSDVFIRVLLVIGGTILVIIGISRMFEPGTTVNQSTAAAGQSGPSRGRGRSTTEDAEEAAEVA